MGNRQPLFNDRYPDDVIGLILMKVDILTLSSCPRICDHVTHETLNICRYCGSSHVRIANARLRCRECGYLASEWEKRRLTLSKYTIWKQLDYRFPYD